MKKQFEVPKDLNLSEDDTKGLESLAKYFNEQFEDCQKGLIDSDELGVKIKSALTEYAKEAGLDSEKMDKLESALKAQGMEIKRLTEGAPSKTQPLQEQLKSLFSKDNIEELKSKRSPHMIGVELKTATSITTANATNAPHALRYEVVQGIHSAPEQAPVILDTLLKGKTSSQNIIWINRVNKEGGSAFIAEGALKPLMDWEYKEEHSNAKKIAVSTKVSTEMLHDFEFMEAEIKKLLTEDLLKVVDQKLLTGSTTDEPVGIIPNAGGYIGTGLDGTVLMPNNADAIRSGMLQMGLLQYKPDRVYLNPTDSAVMDLTKSSTGNYIKIELEGVLRSLKIVETTEIPAGSFLLMDTAKWVVKILEDLRLEFGWENDDFRRNMVTVLAEMRLHSYQNSIDAGSVLYDSFATVKTAIEKV